MTRFLRQRERMKARDCISKAAAAASSARDRWRLATFAMRRGELARQPA
jgi:hypothetical protein